MKLLRVIRSLTEIAELPSGLMNLYQARPRSLASLKIVEGLKKEGINFKTVIDGGANIGQFARAVSTGFPQAQVYSFEPLPDIANQFKANLADAKERVHITESALGSENGEITINRCSASQSSSILKLEDRGKDGLLDSVKEIGQFKVPIVSLDNFFSTITPKNPILLKLDLQGFELEALKGAEKLLLNVDCVLVETVFKQAYTGEPFFEDILDFLKKFGLRFRRPLSFVSEASGEIVQIDALFTKR